MRKGLALAALCFLIIGISLHVLHLDSAAETAGTAAFLLLCVTLVVWDLRLFSKRGKI